MIWCLYWVGLLIMALIGIIEAVVGLKKENDRLFLLGILTMHLSAYISLIYNPQI